MPGKWELQLDREAFLARYWQQRPLLIPQAIPGFSPPIDAHELAGLAMEREVESRIVERQDDCWQLSHGPFAEADYRRESPWTLLVQAVDHHVPGVAGLRRLVDFIPQWRIDDVMVSYATDGGSVGPHFDNYDVFLLQGEGQRLWRLGQFCDGSAALLPHDELRILRDFEATQEYLLHPGDMLYVPPGVAHWGIARGECTTFSIGFRAPRINDMVSRWVDQLLEQLDADDFYHDGRLEPATRPGEIRPRDLERVAAQLQGALDQASGSHWFGELVSEPRYPESIDAADPALLAVPGLAGVELTAWSRLFWQQEPEGVTVYANGRAQTFGENVLPCVEGLCGTWRLERAALQRVLDDTDCRRLLEFLLESGCIDVERGNG